MSRQTATLYFYLTLSDISRTSSNFQPLLFLVSAIFSRQIWNSPFACLVAWLRALLILLSPISLPIPKWLPRCVTRYGIPSSTHRSTSATRVSTDFLYSSSSGQERFGRYGI